MTDTLIPDLPAISDTGWRSLPLNDPWEMLTNSFDADVPGPPIRVKQVIVMRKDLGMRKGKMVAQGAHAAMMWLSHRIAAYGDDNLSSSFTPAETTWLAGTFTKICVSVDSLEELMSVHESACERGLLCNIVVDAGLTEFGGRPTKTCLAIGPDYDYLIDPVTKDLKLL